MGSSPEPTSPGITWFAEFLWLSFVKTASDGTKKLTSMESPVEKTPKVNWLRSLLGFELWTQTPNPSSLFTYCV